MYHNILHRLHFLTYLHSLTLSVWTLLAGITRLEDKYLRAEAFLYKKTDNDVAGNVLAIVSGAATVIG